MSKRDRSVNFVFEFMSNQKSWGTAWDLSVGGNSSRVGVVGGVATASRQSDDVGGVGFDLGRGAASRSGGGRGGASRSGGSSGRGAEA
ncbi:UNVERIFIED_CONTAM: hypothetical protein Sradi_2938000 [Sesamum radiatum]|uniref:Uncharacterized protein n=1 Tax=Sesamum radiatum TaxID=300843 RepID=A0AAW2RZ84_SESRA